MYCMIFIFNTIILQVLYLTTLAGRWYSIEVTGRPKHVLLAMGKNKVIVSYQKNVLAIKYNTK